jgi:hypothetical protein
MLYDKSGERILCARGLILACHGLNKSSLASQLLGEHVDGKWPEVSLTSAADGVRDVPSNGA